MKNTEVWFGCASRKLESQKSLFLLGAVSRLVAVSFCRGKTTASTVNRETRSSLEILQEIRYHLPSSKVRFVTVAPGPNPTAFRAEILKV